jgi:hypothetical protein
MRPSFVCLAAFVVLSAALPAAAPEDAAGAKFFEERVRPVLVENCRQCHGPEKHRGGLRLDSREAALRGGDSGAVIHPGRPEESLLIQAVRHGERIQMPPKKKLPQRVVADLATWVRMGAPWPTASAETTPPPKDTEFWAFRPPVRRPFPAIRDAAWALSPVDRFVLAGIEAKGLHPAPQADKRALLRRVTFDLIGLPPAPEEMEQFLHDDAPDAFSRVVERLLTSPAYGEKWGRHWLDVARYADSNGMDENLAQANAWRYRDWVIRAFNHDMPYDQFVREQVAGDLLPAKDTAEEHDHLVATGFLCLGPKMLAEDDPVKMEMDIIDEQVDTIGRTFLGMTLGCARCHDHKFDPIMMADYYGLAGIFKSTRSMEHFRVVARWFERPLLTADLQRQVKEHDEKVARLRGEIDRQVREAKEKTPHPQPLSRKGRGEKERNDTAKADPEAAFPAETRAALAKLRGELATHEKSRPDVPRTMAVTEGTVADLRIHLRGNHLTLGREVPRRFPEVMRTAVTRAVGRKQSGRLELAQWLTQSEHPLTARVLVNRVWHWHFGQGIVRSTDNFGNLGDRPDNQPLLDWLAVEFVRRGWSIKELHRLIVLSRTYQMSSTRDEHAALIDPENRLLSYRPRRRLEAEELRDALLAVSGRLDRTMRGSLLQTPNFQYVASTFSVNSTNYATNRRSVYLPVVRSALYDPFQVFDFPDPSTANGQRVSTTVAAQALFLMNGDLVREQTRHMAVALLGRSDLDDPARVNAAYLRAFDRKASGAEVSRSLDFVRRLESQWESEKVVDAAERRIRAWQGLCRVLVSTNEFLYVE